MTQKPKPLDLEELIEDICGIFIELYGSIRGEVRDIIKNKIKQRIKSAAQGFTEEIEEIEQNIKKAKREDADYCMGVSIMCQKAKMLIRKYFPEEVKP